jgi:hypothetical protein
MSTATTQMQVGLGEAIERHNTLHKMITGGIATQEHKDEYNLLSSALNEIKLDLGFDCNDDGVPDTIDIFHQSAQTSCCRLIPSGEKPTSRRKSTSRKKTTTTRKKATPAKRKATTTKRKTTATKR